MSNLSFLHSGKKPNLVQDLYTPHATEIENNLIHILFSKPTHKRQSNTTNERANTFTLTAYKIFSSIEPPDLVNKTNKDIFKVCSGLDFKDLSISKVNGLLPDLDPYYIESLSGIGNQDISQFVRHFIEGAVKRRIIELKSSMTYDNKVKIEQEIIYQRNRISVDNYGITDAIKKTKEHIEHIEKYGYGLKTQLGSLNEYIKGFSAGQLIVIGGATSMGKTALGMNIASHIADTHSVLFFSLEMSTPEMVKRVARAECGNDDKKLSASVDKLSTKKLSIVDTAYLGIDEIEKIGYSMSYNTGIDFIVIDYLQIMRMHKSQKLDSLEDITARLKRLAGELQVPIMLISQVNRNNKKDGVVQKPELSNLRGSGSIEQDADIVLLIHRAYYYNKFTNQKDKALIIIGKNRNGETGTLICKWEAEHTMFSEAGYTVNGKVCEDTSNKKISINEVRDKLLKGAKV